MNNDLSNVEKLYIKMLIKAKKLTTNLTIFSKEERRKNLKQAIDIYLESLKFNEANIEILITIAYCNMQLENITENETERKAYLEQAISWTERAIEKGPNIGNLHALLGSLYYISRVDYQAATKEYRIAIALTPYDATNYASAASILYGPPDSPVTLQEAISWLEHAVQLEPDNSDHLAFLGRLYNKAGRRQDAIKTWINAIACHQPLQEGYLQEIKNTLGIE